MIDLLQRLHDHALDLSGHLEGGQAGHDLVRATVSLGRVTFKFVMAASAAIQSGGSILPVFESLAEDATPVWVELSTAMPSLADLLLSAETWEISLLEIAESERWKKTTELATQVIERFVSDGVDLLLSTPGESSTDLFDKFKRVESALDEIIDAYLKPLI